MKQITQPFVSLFLLICLSCPLSARQQTFDEMFHWELSVGPTLWSDHSILRGINNRSSSSNLLVAQLELQYGNWFFETSTHNIAKPMNGTKLGYSLTQLPVGQLDVIIGTYMQELTASGFSRNGQGVVPFLSGLKTRRRATMVGLRLQNYNQHQQWSLELVKDIFAGHNGWLLQATKHWSWGLRNWEVQAGLGLTLYQGRMVDYYFGIDASEARDERPVYSAGASYKIYSGLSAIYPLRKDWLLVLGVGLNHFGNEVTNSPIVASSTEEFAAIDLRYVF